MEKTINQKELGSSWEGANVATATSITDEDIGDILARLQKTDFDRMDVKTSSMHAQVMVALLGKIAKRHDALVKLRDEVETRTRNVAQREEAASLAAMLSKLHGELTPARRPRRRLQDLAHARHPAHAALIPTQRGSSSGRPTAYILPLE